MLPPQAGNPPPGFGISCFQVYFINIQLVLKFVCFIIWGIGLNQHPNKVHFFAFADSCLNVYLKIPVTLSFQF
jgi:hypothetical protein